jgi:hypothetical protein
VIAKTAPIIRNSVILPVGQAIAALLTRFVSALGRR